ncbi:HTH domain-containing protein [Mucilaginibacter sabulilitoris]|uniref:HTH domain-containing protein n=1 Tax=Mucilaginibacter sabulilitoris TaxID=1173583 RepID=A0ABZ0THY6_9SPHI|nr:HTH domain-containing protein [Mucilaginibacter sabulilitoris]WPU92017.1 HTH domain-containing protein [Mucilaginibacter sabulilitoris]
MNRVDRLLEVLAVLQTKKVVTVDYLKEKFHISTRTVYRDIYLLTELRITVMYESQKGCFVLKGYCPPVTEIQSAYKHTAQVSQSIILIPDTLKNEVMALLSAEDIDKNNSK